MNKKVFFTFLLLFSIFTLSLSSSITYGNGIGGEGSTSSTEQAFREALEKQGSFEGTFNQPQIINLPNGQTARISGNVEVKSGEIVSADSINYLNGNLKNVKNFKATSDGYTASSISQLEQDNVLITNGVGISFSSGILTAQHADSLVKDGSITTNANNIKVKTKTFSVEKADSLVSEGIRVDGIQDAEFNIGDKIEVTTNSDVSLKITDGAFNEYTFKGKGNLNVDKSQNPTYIIKGGTLTKTENGYNESIESNNSIIVETDKTFGFKCLTITPVGSYFYNDNDLRKDFVINVPKESSVYKLCLRKNQIQQFKDYNGLVDFVSKKIELNGIVNYLRYPLKNNQIASLLSDFVYKGLKNVKTLLVLDKDLLLLNNIEIKNILQNKQQVTITKPNNYYNIKEMELEDGKIHRIVELNQLNKNQLSQDIFYNYESDSLMPKVKINNNVLVQDNGKNSVTFLPPEHERINQILG